MQLHEKVWHQLFPRLRFFHLVDAEVVEKKYVENAKHRNHSRRNGATNKNSREILFETCYIRF